MQTEQKNYSRMIGWSHAAFIIPITLAAINHIYWHGLLLATAIVVSLIFHAQPASIWRKIDPIFALALISGNLYLCYVGHFQFPFFEIALLFVAIAFYFYFKGKKKDYDLNHSLWHLASAAITTCCLLAYIV